MNNKLHQFGTMQMLVEKLLDGFTTISDLKKLGNVGIGTLSGINGELVILDNKFYQIDGKGNVNILPDKTKVLFGNIHQANFINVGNIKNNSLSDIKKIIPKMINTKNLFYSYKIDGKFSMVHTRSAKESKKPYKGLKEMAQNQAEFKARNIYGTLIGYFTPSLYNGIGVAGFHSHFIDENLSFGGHVIDAEVISGNLSIQRFNSFELHLPESQEFLQADLDNTSKLEQIIETAE